MLRKDRETTSSNSIIECFIFHALTFSHSALLITVDEKAVCVGYNINTEELPLKYQVNEGKRNY